MLKDADAARPAVSTGLTTTVWLPVDRDCGACQLNDQGAAVSVMRRTPSTQSSTRATPRSSLADAVTTSLSTKVAPLTGEVTETVGGLSTGGTGGGVGAGGAGVGVGV